MPGDAVPVDIVLIAGDTVAEYFPLGQDVGHAFWNYDLIFLVSIRILLLKGLTDMIHIRKCLLNLHSRLFAGLLCGAQH